MKQINDANQISKEVENEKNGAANTRKFFVHCLGLQASIRSFKFI